MLKSNAFQKFNLMIRNTITIISLILFISCSKKIHTPLTAQVNVVNEVKHKTIELRSVGFGAKKEDALYDSEKKVFEILFFRGIPNTSIETPLIGSNEPELLNKYKSYFDSFFKYKYKSFIMSTSLASPMQKDKGIFTSVNDVTINILSLKKDLEEHGIIRKFGF
ncbi:MAG: hypothetical protein COA67_04690 [Lutibacter sp.]|nr:MAG: hypothetical protein COA67_04690 [Lutibacter sp.]